jgi:hydroxymethylglutaryl-CoA lyase
MRPDVIPQLDDGVEVLRSLRLPGDIALMVLVPNSRGLDRALEVRDRFHEAAVFVSASETHNRRNVNRTVAESMTGNVELASRIMAEGLRCAAVVATAFGCPYEGRVPLERVPGLAQRFAEAGATEVGFGDTTGMANPAYVRDFFAAAVEQLPGLELTAHFHNTRGQGLAKAYAAWESGCRSSKPALANSAAAPYRPVRPGTWPRRTW